MAKVDSSTKPIHGSAEENAKKLSGGRQKSGQYDLSATSATVADGYEPNSRYLDDIKSFVKSADGGATVYSSVRGDAAASIHASKDRPTRPINDQYDLSNFPASIDEGNSFAASVKGSKKADDSTASLISGKPSAYLDELDRVAVQTTAKNAQKLPPTTKTKSSYAVAPIDKDKVGQTPDTLKPGFPRTKSSYAVGAYTEKVAQTPIVIDKVERQAGMDLPKTAQKPSFMGDSASTHRSFIEDKMSSRSMDTGNMAYAQELPQGTGADYKLGTGSLAGGRRGGQEGRSLSSWSGLSNFSGADDFNMQGGSGSGAGKNNMATPPCYADLGKDARDLFSKGFNYGLFKLDAKTKTESGVEFTTSGNANHDSGKVVGSIETKYKWKEYGMTLSEKWNTDNTLGTEVTVEDQLVQGLKLAFDASFAPQTGKKSGQIKSAYKQEFVHGNCDVDFDFAGPTVHGAAVFGYNNFLAGYQMTFDTAKSALSRNNFAVGYKAGDFTLHTAVNDGTEFAGSIFQKVAKSLDMGVQLTWNTGSSNTRFGIAAKYTPDNLSTFRAKVNNNSQLGLSFQHKLKDGITMTLSSLIEAKNFNAGGHKVGLGLDFEA